jgi:hypothetical protein
MNKMKNYFALIIMTIVLALFNVSLVNAEEPALCYAPYYGGLLPGESSEREAVKLYGEGYYQNLEYVRERFYYNKSKSHTLIVHFGTDNFVTDIFIHEGMKYPHGKTTKNIKPYVSEWFNPLEGFGKWHRLKIGGSRKDAIKWLGPPHKEISNNEWEYRSKCSCGLPAGISVIFDSDKVVTVRFWSSQG